jgi:hypothetical protein
MAVDEAGFKAGFKKDLISAYPGALVWTNTDMFRGGLPDVSAVYNTYFYAMELKFIRKLPKRPDSKCLTHEVSTVQLEFLKKVRENGQHSCVIIGLQDVAVYMLDLKENYTLREVLEAPRINRSGKNWDLNQFFTDARGTREQG